MRGLMWFSTGLCAACMISAYCGSPMSLWTAVCAGLLAVLCFLVIRNRAGRIVSILLAAFALGLGWFALYNGQYLQEVRELDGQVQNIEIEASDYSYQTNYGSSVPGSFVWNGRKIRILAYLDGCQNIEPGSHISGSFQLRFTAYGGAKEPTYHRSEGVFLLAYQKEEITITDTEDISWIHYPAFLRKVLAERIDQLFSGDAAAFAKALLLGDRTDINYDLNTNFKVTGISHIIAVSGLHVSILFGMIYVLLGKNRFLSFAVGVPVLLLFSAVAGFTPSITRACIMQCLILLAMLLNREYDSPTALAFAVLIMVLINPMVVISISFQLSVGCMIGIFLFTSRIHGWMLSEKCLGSAKGKTVIAGIKRWFASSVAVSAGASIMTTPLVAYYFETVSLISLLTNLLVVWVISFIFCGMIICIILTFASFRLARFAASIVSLAIHFVLKIAEVLAKFPLAAVYTNSVYVVVWLAFLYLMLVVFLCLRKRHVLVLFCCAITSLCVALMASWTEPLLDECRVTVLDVGQGQCILLQSQGRTYMVDCGGDSPTEAADTASQTLLSQGIYKLDGLILTHYDEDHTAGVPYLLTRIGADMILLPDMQDESGIRQEIESGNNDRICYVERDLTFAFGETKLTLYAPESKNMGNESSICVLFQTKNCDILITGDRGTLGEMMLLHRTDLPQVDVLIAGHHGAAGSTGEKLLTQVKPRDVLISVGKNNRYGHPAKSLLERVQRIGAAVWRTDISGTIVFRR